MGVLKRAVPLDTNTVYSEAYSVEKKYCLEHAFKEQLWLAATLLFV